MKIGNVLGLPVDKAMAKPSARRNAMTPDPEQFEKLGIFYLGRQFDLERKELLDSLTLYDSRDLTTHALCVGMTGSGKTGLCLAMLEEAAIDGIPAIAIDPKGDLGNLLLTFPQMRPEDFKPWLHAEDAARRGISLDELATRTADTWRNGLAAWGQTPERIARLHDAVELSIYTPGSSAGLPLTVLRSFDAPPAALRQDMDLMREKIAAATSSLLALVGIEGDNLTSRESILLASILDHAWGNGQNVPLGDLIRLIQTPPLERVGVMDLETFMPASDRAKLAMTLNNLLASPTFRVWLQGEPLNIQNLLYTPSGKPRLSILSISHLSDRERMFFVTILLGELLSWTRAQQGTSSLRALFYMDEISGYFPPVANPPSKAPMLALLKQARAFGVGITLATQNPVDLDYKGLANIGTWLLGRLQTERDKQRVLEGLEGAAGEGGQKFDRQKMERTLAGLGSRVFLMNNVHNDSPTVFQSRWALSFLAGPLGRDQIMGLMDPRKQESAPPPSTPTGKGATNPLKPSRPVVPTGIKERFLVGSAAGEAIVRRIYYPAICGHAQVHYVKASAKIDVWQDVSLLVDCRTGVPLQIWQHATPFHKASLADQPALEITFSELPTEMRSATHFKTWTKQLKDFLYRERTLDVLYCKELNLYAPPGVDEQAARIALTQHARERRDEEVAKLREKYAKLDDALTKQIQQAKAKLDREKAEYDQAKWTSMVDVGSSLLGGLLGNHRRRISSTRVSTAIRGATRATQQQAEVKAAESSLTELQQSVYDLNHQAKVEAAELTRMFDPQHLRFEREAITARKGDLKIEPVELVWLPWEGSASGEEVPAW